MRRLDDALLAGDTSRITEIKRQELLATADRDIRELQVHLEKKADDLELRFARSSLGPVRRKRRTPASCSKTRISGSTRPSNVVNVKRPPRRTKAQERQAKAGPTLFDTEDEPKPLYDERARRERAFEKRAMEKRKQDIVREILEEPDRIRGRFAVQTVRLEPVGIVYLWPEMG